MSKKTVISLIALAVILLAGIGVYAAGNYGTKDDPLITKSYLDAVVKPELQKQLQTELSDAVNEIRGGGSGEFAVVTLYNGQTVTCGVGTEIMPRLGSVKANGASAPALIDTTTGNSISAGTVLSANHLYMVSIEGNGITAAADNTKVLISGVYTVQ